MEATSAVVTAPRRATSFPSVPTTASALCDSLDPINDGRCLGFSFFPHPGSIVDSLSSLVSRPFVKHAKTNSAFFLLPLLAAMQFPNCTLFSCFSTFRPSCDSYSQCVESLFFALALYLNSLLDLPNDRVTIFHCTMQGLDFFGLVLLPFLAVLSAASSSSRIVFAKNSLLYLLRNSRVEHFILRP